MVPILLDVDLQLKTKPNNTLYKLIVFSYGCCLFSLCVCINVLKRRHNNAYLNETVYMKYSLKNKIRLNIVKSNLSTGLTIVKLIT